MPIFFLTIWPSLIVTNEHPLVLGVCEENSESLGIGTGNSPPAEPSGELILLNTPSSLQTVLNPALSSLILWHNSDLNLGQEFIGVGSVTIVDLVKLKRITARFPVTLGQIAI